MLFAVPINGKVYVGTTDTFFDGDTKNPKMTESDRDLILLTPLIICFQKQKSQLWLSNQVGLC